MTTALHPGVAAAAAQYEITCLRVLRFVLIALLGLITAAARAAAPAPISAVAGQPNVVVKDLAAEVESVSSTGLAAPKAVAGAADPKKWDIQLTADAKDIGKQIVVTYKLKGAADPVSQPVFVVSATSLWGDSYSPVLKALFALFVVAVLLELALGLLFTWSKFLAVFDAKGVKTIISFAVALVLVNTLGLDILAHVVSLIWNPQVKSDMLTSTLSAMVLAGGSNVVNTLFLALGFRSPRTAESVQAKPPPTKAWISVRIVRQDTKGTNETVKVAMRQRTSTGNEDFVDVALIDGADWRKSVLAWFFRDPMRFPGAGGYSVLPNTPCEVKASTTIGGKAKEFPAGPFTLPPGGMLDIVITV